MNKIKAIFNLNFNKKPLKTVWPDCKAFILSNIHIITNGYLDTPFFIQKFK